MKRELNVFRRGHSNRFVFRNALMTLSEAFLIFIIFTSTNVPVAFAEDYISNEQFISTINSGDVDRIRETMNSIKQMRYKGEIIPLMRDIWLQEEESLPELRKDIINLPIVRMEIANILLQEIRNSSLNIKVSSIRSETIGNIEKDDVDLVRLAISNLSILDDERDVPLLKSIADRHERATFRSAVLALASMCSRSAQEALQAVELETTNVSELSFIDSTRSAMNSVREVWCREL